MKTERINRSTFIDPAILASLDNLELRARVVVEGFLAGLHKSPKRGFSVEFTDYRHYVRGDDLRHVDWKLYGRTDKLYIRQYEDETNVRSYVVLDSSASMACGEQALSKMDYAKTLASALAYFMIQQRDAVGLISYDEVVNDYVPAKARKQHLLTLLRSIHRLQAAHHTNSVKPLQELAASLRQRSQIVFISDMLSDEVDTIRTLRQLRAMGNEVIVFHVLDEQELGFSFNESSAFVDLETGERYLTTPGAIRDSYLENLQLYLDYCRTQCQRGGVDYCLLSTANPLDRALAAYLSSRSRLS